jgi:hypothetical protein
MWGIFSTIIIKISSNNGRIIGKKAIGVTGGVT